MIQLKDKTFETFIRKEEISNKIDDLTSAINADFKGQEVIFIAILNGSFMFAADLMKKINLDCEISFIKVSSYVGTASTGRVDEIIGLNTSITNKNVVIIEDIVDTGITMDKVISLLGNEKPLSLKICTLLYKEEAFKGKNVPHYVGFNIPNKFVVGYGLDYDEKGRNLDEIYQLKEN